MLQDCDDRQLRLRAVPHKLAQRRGSEATDLAENLNDDLTGKRHIADDQVSLPPRRLLNDPDADELVDQLPSPRLSNAHSLAHFSVSWTTPASSQLLDQKGE